MSNKEVLEISDDLKKILPYHLQKVFEGKIEDVKDEAIDSYEINLLGAYIPRGSLSDPTKFLDEYKESLDRFEYITDNASGGKDFNIPDADTFDFSNIQVIHVLVEGVAGNYKELAETDLKKLLTTKEISSMIKNKLRQLPDLFKGTASVRDRFTLVPTRGTLLKTIQASLGKELIKFPFSNTLPIDLFEPVSMYVHNNINSWVNEAVKISTEKIKLSHR